MPSCLPPFCRWLPKLSQSPAYNNSKSSPVPLHLSTVPRILLPTPHVTQSSKPLVTKNAVSVTTSVPTLTCPCSISLFAACTFSAMCSRVITTGRRRRQNALTVILRGMRESVAVEELLGREVVGSEEVVLGEGRVRGSCVSKPMECSLERSKWVCLARKGEEGGRRERRWASCWICCNSYQPFPSPSSIER